MHTTTHPHRGRSHHRLFQHPLLISLIDPDRVNLDEYNFLLSPTLGLFLFAAKYRREMIKTIRCPLGLCGSTLPALLAASHLLDFHSLGHVLDTTHTHVGGSFLQFGRRLGWVWVRPGAESSRSRILSSSRAPEVSPFAMCHRIWLSWTQSVDLWPEELRLPNCCFRAQIAPRAA